MSRVRTYESTVFGPTCDALDTLLTGFQLRNSVSDRLVFPNMGAYTAKTLYRGMKQYKNGYEKSFRSIPPDILMVLSVEESRSPEYKSLVCRLPKRVRGDLWMMAHIVWDWIACLIATNITHPIGRSSQRSRINRYFTFRVNNLRISWILAIGFHKIGEKRERDMSHVFDFESFMYRVKNQRSQRQASRLTSVLRGAKGSMLMLLWVKYSNVSTLQEVVGPPAMPTIRQGGTTTKAQLLFEAASNGNLWRLKNLAAELDVEKRIAATVASIKNSKGESTLHLGAAEGNGDICNWGFVMAAVDWPEELNQFKPGDEEAKNVVIDFFGLAGRLSQLFNPNIPKSISKRILHSAFGVKREACLSCFFTKVRIMTLRRIVVPEVPSPDEVEVYLVLQDCLRLRENYVFREEVAPWDKEVITDPSTPKPGPNSFSYSSEAKTNYNYYNVKHSIQNSSPDSGQNILKSDPRVGDESGQTILVAQGPQKELAFKDIYDVSDAIKYALKAEEFIRSSPSTTASATSTLVASSSKPPPTKVGPVTCYECKEIGHVRSECPKRKRVGLTQDEENFTPSERSH
ncbi:hypothetical protein IFM89_024749 [Coptis chinensis]|uniref:CCHC-type domain-containing protein n=1 Tax=Coptis chinensis TaxID=261450 RepID=A0A835LBN2_9MAGN|nr:hypothetical protein IFM89_024749 [Coptis chinensis]